jgi:hypothetical protein
VLKKAIGYLVLLLLSARCVVAAESKLNNYIGLRFSGFDLPQECQFVARRFNFNEFDDGKSILYVTEYKCSGQEQLWLMRAVDRNGATIPHDHQFQLNEKKEFVVEDVYLLLPFKKREELISEGCTRNGIEPDVDFPFAFAIGKTAPIYDGRHMEIGSKSTSISEAWKVNLTRRKFERIPTKGIVCAAWGG